MPAGDGAVTGQGGSCPSAPPQRGGASAAELVPSFYDLILWFAPKLAQFPRIHRFTLGDRIMTLLLELLDGLIVAQYEREARVAALRRANVGLERLRYLVRLARDLHCLTLQEYEHAARELVGTGQRVGGWLRHARSRPGVGGR